MLYPFFPAPYLSTCWTSCQRNNQGSGSWGWSTIEEVENFPYSESESTFCPFPPSLPPYTRDKSKSFFGSRFFCGFVFCLTRFAVKRFGWEITLSFFLLLLPTFHFWDKGKWKRARKKIGALFGGKNLKDVFVLYFNPNLALSLCASLLALTSTCSYVHTRFYFKSKQK